MNHTNFDDVSLMELKSLSDDSEEKGENSQRKMNEISF